MLNMVILWKNSLLFKGFYDFTAYYYICKIETRKGEFLYMRRTISMLTVIFMLAALWVVVPQSAEAATEGGLKYTVTVSKFENESNWAGQWALGDAWGAIMTDILNQSGRFIVLGERDMRNEAMDEQDLASSGRTVQGPITPVTGQMTPAQILVKGAITHAQDTSGGGGGVSIGGFSVGGSKANAEINVTMYMIDSTTGQVLASTRVVGKSSNRGGGVRYSNSNYSVGGSGYKKDNMGKAVENAVQQGVDWMVQQLPSIPWSGSVVTVRDGRVYINRGQREGVQSGQTFVVGWSEVIRDPGTGEVLEEIVHEKGRIKVVTAREKLSICDIISGDEEFEVGMKICLP